MRRAAYGWLAGRGQDWLGGIKLQHWICWAPAGRCSTPYSVPSAVQVADPFYVLGDGRDMSCGGDLGSMQTGSQALEALCREVGLCEYQMVEVRRSCSEDADGVYESS